MRIIKEDNLEAIDIAIRELEDGNIISFATDTVYGIAADASNPKAVESIYKLKKRSQNKPIAIFLKDIKKAKQIFIFDELSEKIAENFMPGSVTLVLKVKNKNNRNLAKNLNYNDDNFIGFRIVRTNFLENLFEKFNGVLAVTSANISDRRSSICAQEVYDSFKDNTDITKSSEILSVIFDGGNLENRLSSTVIKSYNNKCEIIRHGKLDITKYINKF